MRSVLYFPQARGFLQPVQPASPQAEQQEQEALQKSMAQAEPQGLPAYQELTAYRELLVQPVSQAQTANHSAGPPALARL